MRVVKGESIHNFSTLRPGDVFMCDLRTLVMVKTSMVGYAMVLDSGEMIEVTPHDRACTAVSGAFYIFNTREHHCDCCEYGGHEP